MLLRVRVVPNSRKAQIEELGQSHLRVKVLAPPARGRANRELIETLARYSKQSVEIRKGPHSRDKIVEIKEESQVRHANDRSKGLSVPSSE